MRFPDQAERDKRAQLIALLDDGLVRVHLDARRDGVDLPEHLRGDLMLSLNLSRRFQLEMFEVGPLAVKASLSFGGERYPCVLPYRAIWRLESRETGEVALFEDTVPPELLAAAEAAEAAASEALEGETSGQAAAPAAQPTSQSPAPEPEQAPAASRPTLRIVK